MYYLFSILNIFKISIFKLNFHKIEIVITLENLTFTFLLDALSHYVGKLQARLAVHNCEYTKISSKLNSD